MKVLKATKAVKAKKVKKAKKNLLDSIRSKIRDKNVKKAKSRSFFAVLCGLWSLNDQRPFLEIASKLNFSEGT